MLIKERKQAIADGDSIFYTGRPCSNGHLTYRYTSSGSCKSCLTGTGSPLRMLEKVKALREQADKMEKEARDAIQYVPIMTNRDLNNQLLFERTQVLTRFVEFWEPVDFRDIEAATSILLKYAHARNELISAKEVFHKIKPKAGGVRRMACHESDLQAVRNELENLRKARGVAPLPDILNPAESFDPKYRELGIKCPPSHLDLLTSLVQYYAMARYGSDINLDEFVPQAQGASAPDMYWIKCDAEDLPVIKQALEG